MDIKFTISIILTIFFGLFALYKRKYPGSITFLREESIELIDSFVNNFPQIDIYYEKNILKNKLIYLKGNLINDGKIDITKEMTEKGITFTLPDEYIWKSVKITNTTSNLNCNYELNNSELVFNIGLFKINDLFQFESLIETKETNKPITKLIKSLKITHRIANTKKISQAEVINTSNVDSYKKQYKKKLFIVSINLLMFVLLLIFPIIFDTASNYNLSFNSQNIVGDSIIYKTSPEDEYHIKLTPINGEGDKILDIKELNKSNTYVPVISKKKYYEHFISYSLPLLVILMNNIQLVGSLFKYRKSKKLSDLLNKG